MEGGRPASYEMGWDGMWIGVLATLRDDLGLLDDEIGGVDGVSRSFWEALLPTGSGGVRGADECIGETLI